MLTVRRVRVNQTHRIVNADATIISFRQCLCVFQRKVSRHGQEHDITLSRLVHIKQFHYHLTIFGSVNDTSRRPPAAKDAQTTHRKVALFQTLTNFLSDSARGSDNSDLKRICRGGCCSHSDSELRVTAAAAAAETGCESTAGYKSAAFR